MTKQQAVGFISCALWITTSVADSETSFSVRKKACSIELSMLKSPNAYLVAMVKHTEKAKCDDNSCLAKLAVIEVFSAGDRSARLSSIDVGYSIKTRDNGGQYPEGRTIGVYVPAPNGTYGWLIVTSPADSTVIAEYEQAVSLAALTPASAPHCEKSTAPP